MNQATEAKTQADLYREYGRILDMTRDTNLQGTPYHCVKLHGVTLNYRPSFTEPPNGYTFALTILEDRPVFVGDILYVVGVHQLVSSIKVHGISYNRWLLDAAGVGVWGPGMLTFADPTPVRKREFILNQKRLPIPLPEDAVAHTDRLILTWKRADGRIVVSTRMFYGDLSSAGKAFGILKSVMDDAKGLD